MTQLAARALRFQAGGNGAGLLREGWGVPEEHGAWTIGVRSHIQLYLAPGQDYRCVMPATPMVCPPGLMDRALSVAVNGVTVFEGRLAAAQSVTFDIAGGLIGGDGLVDIVLLTDRAASPAELGLADDGRELGFAVWGLDFTPTRVAAVAAAVSAPVRVAAVTMVFNEAEYLPIWLRHYGKQVGIENCYVVDHGSTDGSTEGLGPCNVVRIPRSAYDPHKQSAFNTQFSNALLSWFDWVVYSDVDELLVADPLIASSLAEYCRKPLPGVVSAIGLNVLHRPGVEPALDLERLVTEQRGTVFACSSMCKPLLINRSVAWSPGSHSSDDPIRFDHLYMFHLRWYDLDAGLRRLQRTRAMAWARSDTGAHQRVRDDEWREQLRGFAALPVHAATDLRRGEAPLEPFLDRVSASRAGREDALYKIDLDIWPSALWRLPERFRGIF